MMPLEQAIRIVRRELKRHGYSDTIEQRSATTNSVYFMMRDSNAGMCFRLSDHKTKKRMMTLRVDMIKSEVEVVNFVRNRVFGMQKRSVCAAFGTKR